MRYLLTTLVCAMLSACGFHLRGNDVLPDNVSSIYVQHDKRTLFTQALENSLRLRGVSVSRTRAQANAVVTIANDESGQRILSVTVTEGPEEYEVFQTITYSYSANREALIENKELTLTRDYTFDKNDILGKRQEFESLQKALAAQMADMMIRQMRFAH